LSPSAAGTNRHRAVIAIVYVHFDHMLIDHAPWSRAGPEVARRFAF
jgi:hypothetical protein